MNSFVETLNHWGGYFLDFAWPMLWQSSLLIVVLLAFDFVFRRKIRASIRYALWLVVLVKLCLPPTLALPTSPAWWVHKTPPPPAATPATLHYTVTYGSEPLPTIPQNPLPAFAPPKPAMTNAAWLLVSSATISSALLFWLLARWWQITRQVRLAAISERLSAIAGEAQKSAGMKSKVRVQLTANSMSPAVCGLFRPTILIPQSLAENFSDDQLRAVLLHELFHLRRRDVWLNFAQALLQVAYWWHPLLWLANARIRRVREEAVDDTVMLALRDEAESYAPTLLEVAKLALNRPLASLGLVGILESRSALRQRIERLVDFRPPRKAGLTLVSFFGILAFTAVAVPMGGAPDPAEKPSSIDAAAVEQHTLTLKVNPETFIQNVKAQAGNSMLAPTIDYAAILLDVLRSEGVDCVPPNGIAFNTKTGEITTQNTPDKLEVFRQVIEQLNRADGKCDLPLRNNFHRESVLIEARIYQMPAADFENIFSGLRIHQGSPGSDAWWSASPEQFNQLDGNLESSGLQFIARPRIKTGSGMPAEFYVGNGANSVELDCKPYAGNWFVDLTLQCTVVTGASANTAVTNHFITRASAENRGGIVVRVKNNGGEAESNLVAVIGVQIVTNTPSPHFQQRPQAIIERQSETNENATNLFERTFEVYPRTFYSGLDSVSPFGRSSTNNGGVSGGGLRSITTGSLNYDVSWAARNFFTTLGIDMANPSGKSVLFNDRLGMLFVKASASDLDTIERAVAVLNQGAPQVHIKARFVEVPKKGFVDPPQLTNNSAGGVMGFLTSEQVQSTLRMLEAKPGFETLGEPEAVTTSGRLTQIRATQTITVVTNLVLPDTWTNQAGSIITHAIVPQTIQVETGPVVDVVPYVLSDGYTIDLKTTASVTEFLGYAETNNSVPVINLGGVMVPMPPVLPRFRVRQAMAHLRLWDNQTVVLGGLSLANSSNDRVQVLGDLPIVGRLFQSQEQMTNEIFVFITATIVDPAGNRIHSDEEMPFTKDGVPAQPRN